MAQINRREHLKVVHETRKENTLKKVDEAIKRLIKSKENINFNSVANEARVAKATLYNRQDIRKCIENLRKEQANVPTPRQVKREMDNSNKDALIASLKRKIQKLESDNRQLKDQLKGAYSDIYKNI